MSIVITLEVDDKGSAKIKDFSNNAQKDLDSVSKSGNMLTSNMSSGFNRIGDSVYSASMAITKFAIAFSTGALVAGAAGIALVTEKAGALEQQMSYLGAILEASKPQMDTLKESILGLSTSSQFMSKDIGNAATTLAQAGFTATEVTSALPGVLSLATAGAVDLSTASDVASASLRSFGFATSETGKIADVLAQASNKTNTNVANLGEALKYVGPVARTAGISFQEVSAAIGLLGNVGIQGSMAGTTLRAAIASLLAPTTQQTEILNQLGVQVTDSSGKMLSFTNIIQQLQGAGIQTGQVLELFGLRGGPGMAALISMGSESLKNLTIDLENAGGKADEVGKEKMNNFSGQMQIAKANIEAFMISLGDPMLPIFKDFIMNSIIPTLQSMIEWAKANKNEIANFAQEIVTFVKYTGTALQEFLKFTQSILVPVLATCFQTIGDSIGFAGAAIVTLIDGISQIGEWLNKIPLAVRLVVPGLESFALMANAVKNSNTGFRDSIEELSVSSMTLGSKLTDLTMDAGDMLNSFNSLGLNMDTTKVKTDNLTTSTTTLQNAVSGGLVPSIIDAEWEYGKMQEQQRLTEANQNNLSNSTIESVDYMNTALSSLDGSWSDITSSIDNATQSANSFGSSASSFNQQTRTGAGAGAGNTTYQAKMSNNDIIEWYRRMGWGNPTDQYGRPLQWDFSGGRNTANMKEGGFINANPNQAVPAILHGGETVIPNGANIIVQLILNEKVLAEEVININDRNVSGFGNKFTPTKKNIKNFQQMGV